MNNVAEGVPATTVDEDWGLRAHVHTLVMLAITLIALYLCYRMTVPFLSSLV